MNGCRELRGRVRQDLNAVSVSHHSVVLPDLLNTLLTLVMAAAALSGSGNMMLIVRHEDVLIKPIVALKDAATELMERYSAG